MGGAVSARPTPVVGLRREREVLTVALATGRHVVIEGPPGTGKSTLLRSIARDGGRTMVFVEGNAELTPARLIGQFDPSQVLAEGYHPASFVDGPLLTAMRGGAARSGEPSSGGLLYLEELNRVPEETLNVLITVLTEGEIAVPRLGTVRAGEGFRLIAAMNPFDAVGTARVSQAIADRMCRVVLGYQDEQAENTITSSVTGLDGEAVRVAVALTRATREHRDVRMGSSVRGAIDMALVLTGLARMRGEAQPSRETGRDAAYAALSGRIRIADGVDRPPESVIDELLDRLWPDSEQPPDVVRPPDGQGKADGLPNPSAGFQPRSRPGRERAGRTKGRRELAARHESFDEVSPDLGELDVEAFGAALARDPEAAAAMLADMAVATDEQLRAAARRLAGRVFIQLGRVGPARARGTRRLGPSSGWEGDLDLDRTLDAWTPGPTRRPGADDIVTRTWTAHRRAVSLVVDISGSMQGLAVALAAVAAAGVVIAAEGKLEPSVLAFGAGVRVLQAQGARRQREELLSELVALRGHGTTDLAAGLREASRQLAGAVADERVVVLLSDCLHTAGDEPAEALGGIDRLHVLVPLAGAEAETTAATLAARGGGRAQPVARLSEVAPALTRILA
jgi:magnesium chelatase subunit D